VALHLVHPQTGAELGVIRAKVREQGPLLPCSSHNSLLLIFIKLKILASERFHAQKAEYASSATPMPCVHSALMPMPDCIGRAN